VPKGIGLSPVKKRELLGMNKKLKMMFVCCSSATAITAMLAAPAAFGQDSETFTVTGKLELGAEYNSNVSVTELESASGEADYAGLLDAGIDLNWKPTERFSADAGYSYSSSQYQDFDEFDLDLHLLYADASYDLDIFTIGANHYYGDADLGGSDFLTLKQYSVYAARLFGDSFYLRGALNFADKSFDTFAGRNADAEGFNVDGFWYFNGGKSSVVLGYAYSDEDTLASQFDYKGHTLRARYSNRFMVAAKDAQIQLGLRMQERNYSSVTPSINSRRDDRQRLAEARFEVSLTSYLTLLSQLEYGNYSSNLSSADYDETRASLGMRLSF
jgi:hypothetical protein